MGTNLQGYHLLWPDLPTFSQLQFTAPFTNRISRKGACLVFPSSNPRMKPGEKEVNTFWRNLRLSFSSKPQSALARRY